MKKTGQSYETVRRQFDEFYSICPEGVMTRRKFLDLSKSALGEQSEFMAENLFRFEILPDLWSNLNRWHIEYLIVMIAELLSFLNTCWLLMLPTWTLLRINSTGCLMFSIMMAVAQFPLEKFSSLSGIRIIFLCCTWSFVESKWAL